MTTFHEQYYASNVWAGRTRWRGVAVQKAPTDLWVYQEIIHQVRPRLIIETGTAEGGSALFLADVMDVVCGRANVLSIDTNPRVGWTDPRITFIRGSSTAPEIIKPVRLTAQVAAEEGAVLVVLDSDHSAPHVAAELALYSGLVTVGSYLIVEDTNINGHPVSPGWGPGPAEALHAWLPEHPEFEIDREREKFMLTFNPGGYLRRAR